MTRLEHLAWAKERALEYVEHGDLKNAVTSMTSDLLKHEGFDYETTMFLATVGMMDAAKGDTGAVRHWVEGFN